MLYFADLRICLLNVYSCPTWPSWGPSRNVQSEMASLSSHLSPIYSHSCSYIGVALAFLYLEQNTLFLSSLVKVDGILFQPSTARTLKEF
jgi:hypothetical protein